MNNFYPPFGFPPFKKSSPYKNSYFPSDFSHTNSNYNYDFKDTNIDNDEKCFDILGIKLYFDDLLIICLLIFLYNEEVKDTYLYIALLLLLLS